METLKILPIQRMYRETVSLIYYYFTILSPTNKISFMYIAETIFNKLSLLLFYGGRYTVFSVESAFYKVLKHSKKSFIKDFLFE